VTVTLKAAEWLVAEVAATVMLKVPGGVPIFGGGVLLPPPQLTRERPSVTTPNAKDHLLIFLPRLPIPETNTPNAMATNHAAKVQGAKVQGCGTPVGTAAALCAVVVMVSVVDTGLPPGVRLAGEKLQLEAAGNPLQENVMAELRPLTGLTVMVNVAVWPALMVALCGDAFTVKSPGSEARMSSTRVGDMAWGNVASPP